MGHIQGALELLLGLLIAVAFLASIARRISVAYPILLVIGGLLLGLCPALPALVLPPELVFLVVLPPLLFAAAWNSPWREFRENKRPIGFLSVGLVFATLVSVAAVAHAMLGLPVVVGIHPRRNRVAHGRARGDVDGEPARSAASRGHDPRG